MNYKIIGGKEYITLSNAAKEFGIHEYTLKKNLEKFKIPVARSKTATYITKELLESWIEEKKDVINFKEFMKQLIEKTNSNYTTSSRYIGKINTLCEGYKYWGIEIKTNLPYIADAQSEIFIRKKDVKKLEEKLFDEFSLYHKTYGEKIDYLCSCENLKDKKNLIEHIRKYHEKVIRGEQSPYVEMVNFLRLTLEKDLKEYSDVEIIKYIETAREELTQKACKLLVKFYTYLQSEEKCRCMTRLRFDKKKTDEKYDTTPYAPEIYISVAYMTFNEEYWKKENLIEKASKSEWLAKTWMYHAMHFICSWRKGDILSSVPRIDLYDTPEKVLEDIRKQVTSDEKYKKAAMQLESMVNYMGLKPQKTMNLKKSGTLHISIPEDYRTTIGMIALMCEAHSRIKKKKKSLCEMKSIELKHATRLFGNEYIRVLEGKIFSNRRANKNYMERLLDEGGNLNIDGYLLAAYARSHTGGINRIPEVTSKYLTTKMDGYSIDEVSKVLFERGVCSFVPYMLCLAIKGKEFQDKNIFEQTQEMKRINFTPWDIEKVLEIDKKVEKRVKNTLNEIIKWIDEENAYEIIKDVLDNVSMGKCIGKTEGVYCLRKACNKECSQINRKSCIGCGNEMYVRSFLLGLHNEIEYQKKYLEQAVTIGERIKCTAILEEKLYPAAFEMLAVIKNVYKEDIEVYKKLLLGEK